MQQKAEHDCVIIMNFIQTHAKFNNIYSAFIKGPKPDCGFMWTPDDWWTSKEKEAVKIVSNKVLDYDWDSSGYGYMMRMIESKIKEIKEFRDEIMECFQPVVAVEDNLQDDECKWSGYVRTAQEAFESLNVGNKLDKRRL